MRVKVYAVNQATGEESLDRECTLGEFFEISSSENSDYNEAQEGLEDTGRYWVGGGSEALFLLVRQS